MIHGAGWSHHRHDVGPPAVGPHGQAATDHLAHCGEVGGDTEFGLGTAVADAETGHHLVEYQQGAVFFGELADALEEARLGGDKARIAHHWLKNHAGNFTRVFGEELLDGF